jgi:hypothetical protein
MVVGVGRRGRAQGFLLTGGKILSSKIPISAYPYSYNERGLFWSLFSIPTLLFPVEEGA